MANVPATTNSEASRISDSGAAALGASSGRGDFFSGFGQLDVLRQLGLMVGLAVSVALGFSVVLWSQGDSYQPVFGNMEGYDASAIMAALETEDADYRVDPATGVILVPSESLANIRLRLAAAGVTRYGGTGYELLDEEQALGTSQFMEANRVKRSQEGELQRTITNFRNVQTARVHIAIPERSVFVRATRKPTASVFLTLTSGASLSEMQVGAIANLVASSVPELVAEDVTIVDQRGNLLSETEANSSLEMAEQQYAYTRKFESTLVERVSSILRPIVGYEGFHAEVTADIDFTQLEQAAESYDPNGAAIRSEQTMEEFGAADPAVGGVPGTLANQPDADPAALSLAEVEGVANRRQQATRNYELGRQVSYTNHDPVAVNRVSVAVVLDNKAAASAEEASQPWTDAEIAQITTLVQDAVGFDVERGDSVTVMNNAFARIEAPTIAAIPVWQQSWAQNLIKQVLAGLFVLLVVFGVLRPVLQNLAKANVESRQLAVAATQGDFSDLQLAEAAMADDDVRFSGAGDAMLPGPDGGYERQLNTVRGLVAEDPGRVAQVVKQWVGEEGE